MISPLALIGVLVVIVGLVRFIVFNASPQKTELYLDHGMALVLFAFIVFPQREATLW